jgi:uncharacterized membrane protein
MLRSLAPSAKMKLKLQFSLATLLVCVTVMAVVCGVCLQIPVMKPHHFTIAGQPMYLLTDSGEYANQPPTTSEIVQRLAIWVPTSIAATLAVQWSIGRLNLAATQSRRSDRMKA